MFCPYALELDYQLPKGLKMTIGQIITFALISCAFWLGNRSGYANGYVAGRKAVRKHYEKLEHQFKVSR